MRRLAQSTRRIAALVVFATILPMCSSAMALPRKQITELKLKHPNSASKKRRTALRLRAAIDIADGKIVEYELCAKKFDVLLRRQKLLQKKNTSKGEKEMFKNLLWDMHVIREVIRQPDFYLKPDRLRIVLSNIKSNLYALQNLSKTKPKLVNAYFEIIALSGFPKVAQNLKQYLNNPDVLMFYEQMFRSVCKQKR